MYLLPDNWFLVCFCILLVALRAVEVHILRGITDRGTLRRKQVELRLAGVGVVFVFLVFNLPNLAVLQTFGFPDSVTDVATPHQTLEQLQELNQAIVRIGEVCFISLSVVAFQLFSVARYLRSSGDEISFSGIRETVGE